MLLPGTKGLTGFNMTQFLLKGDFYKNIALAENWLPAWFTVFGFYNYVIEGTNWKSDKSKMELFVKIFNET